MFVRLVSVLLVLSFEVALCDGRQPQPHTLIAKGDRIILIGFPDTRRPKSPTKKSPLAGYAYLPIDGYTPESDANFVENVTAFHWTSIASGAPGFELESINIKSIRLTKVTARSNFVDIAVRYSHFYVVAEEPVTIGKAKLVESMDKTVLAGYKRWPSLYNDFSELRIYDREKLLYKGSFSVESRAPARRSEIALSCDLKCETQPVTDALEHTISGELSVVSRFLSFKIGELRIARVGDDKFQIAKESWESILQINDLSGQTIGGLPCYYRERPLPYP